jgi:uncharacterized RDD family membrane protein YckC
MREGAALRKELALSCNSGIQGWSASLDVIYSSFMSSIAVNICSGCGCELQGRSFCPHCSESLDTSVATASKVSSIAGEHVCAPVWRRFVAAIFDVVLALALMFPIALVLMWIMEAYHSQIGLSEFKSRGVMGSTVALLWIVWFWIYCAAAESSVHQATPGKRLLRLKVSSTHGERVGFYQATCRYYAKFLSTFALLAGFVMAAFHSRRMSLHDMVAGTMVIRSR